MIEVDLHPDGKRGGRDRRGLALPSLDRVPGWHEVRADPWHAAFLVCLVLVPLLVVGLWLSVRNDRSELLTEIERVRADSARLGERAALGDSLAARREVLAERIATVRGLDRDRFVWPHLMDELSRALPQGAWLTAVATESPLPEPLVRIEGRARAPLVITEFVRALQASPYVGGVEIRGSRRIVLDRGHAQSFTLLVTYRSSPESGRRTRPLVPEES